MSSELLGAVQSGRQVLQPCAFALLVTKTRWTGNSSDKLPTAVPALAVTAIPAIASNCAGTES